MECLQLEDNSELRIIEEPSSQRSPSPKQLLNNRVLFSIDENPLYRSPRHFRRQILNARSVMLSQPIQDMDNILTPPSITNLKQWPPKVLNVLQRGHVNGINPYLQALTEIICTNHKLPEEELKRVKEVCYVGIGKGLVEEKQITRLPYRRVNLLIREYMIDQITDQVSSLQNLNPKHFYVECNDKGLGFKTNNYKAQYLCLLSQASYRRVISQSNCLIEAEYLNFKKKKDMSVDFAISRSSWVCLLGMVLIVVYCYIRSLTVLVMGLLLISCGVGMNVWGVLLQERKGVENPNVIDEIQKKLEMFLESVSQREEFRHKCVWKCGRDFYWLEVVPDGS